jgi:hypothetical protein
MKVSNTKLATEPQTSVFPQTLHRVRQRGDAGTPIPTSQKRDNVFSKSRDTREDRGLRQLKTSHNSQTLQRGR